MLASVGKHEGIKYLMLTHWIGLALTKVTLATVHFFLLQALVLLSIDCVLKQMQIINRVKV